MANAAAFVEEFGADVRYAADLRCFFVYDGESWRRDADGVVAAGLAQRTLRRLATLAAQRAAEAVQAIAAAGDDKAAAAAAESVKARAEEELKWARRSCTERPIRDLLSIARPYVLVPAAGDVFDRHPHLLNCPNGTVDLRTGELRPQRREDFITKLCPTRYDPGAEAPQYHAFLRSILTTPEVVEYVRDLSGYALTGEVTDQSLVIFHGRGANGKTTLLELWQGVMGAGQYAVTAPSELLVGGGENRHPAEKAVLRGARLAVCQETDDDEPLDAKRVKALTGGSSVQARGMRENFNEFPPTHKLVLATNHLPRVRTNDHATWRRIRVVSFDRVFWSDADRGQDPDGDYPAELRADPELPARLRAEAEGVLADLVSRAKRFYAGGRQITPPANVSRAVSSYRKTEDVIGRFFTACCSADRDVPPVKAAQFYATFREWYKREVDPTEKDCPGTRKFGERAAERFGRKERGGSLYYAVRVVPSGIVGEDRSGE